ncbi:hypothetical protein G6L26_009535 [Agrobacterium radiobacter]|uniref:hypothetical protein n=1 Tax=Agrobacterium tumefaciens complex TaxID=1183400 RepID=UPI00080F8C43|nr:hypothetical protein [Agrobacterium tumefaciens]NTA05426.1 hypothetical protein [Agrobacterium tumefaciens]NTA92019.1 hypothetical protein [Agrobacterium tumefaciens]OCJ32181.1 hypothetical protein A6U90_09700 [Agrobacterium tumefaciens]
METTRKKIGPFSFTFRGNVAWWSYRKKHFGTLIKASGRDNISTVDKLKAFFDPACQIYGADGLETFVRWNMSDIPGALHWAEHYTRCRSSVIR